jgi:hypothetical protein
MRDDALLIERARRVAAKVAPLMFARHADASIAGNFIYSPLPRLHLMGATQSLDVLTRQASIAFCFSAIAEQAMVKQRFVSIPFDNQ